MENYIFLYLKQHLRNFCSPDAILNGKFKAIVSELAIEMSPITTDKPAKIDPSHPQIKVKECNWKQQILFIFKNKNNFAIELNLLGRCFNTDEFLKNFAIFSFEDCTWKNMRKLYIFF